MNKEKIRIRNAVENMWDEEEVIYVSASEGMEDDKVLYEVKNSKVCYFVRAGAFGPIKIGNTTDPRKRIQGAQTDCPDTLILLGLTFDDEKELHRKFKEERRRGEWFVPSNRIISYIKENRLHEGDV